MHLPVLLADGIAMKGEGIGNNYGAVHVRIDYLLPGETGRMLFGLDAAPAERPVL